MADKKTPADDTAPAEAAAPVEKKAAAAKKVPVEKKAKSLADLGALAAAKPEPAPEPATEATAETAAEIAPVEEVAAPAAPQQIEAVLREQQLDKFGRAYATGR